MGRPRTVHTLYSPAVWRHHLREHDRPPFHRLALTPRDLIAHHCLVSGSGAWDYTPDILLQATRQKFGRRALGLAQLRRP